MNHVLKVKTGKLREVRTDVDEGAVTMVFSGDHVELHPGHFLAGNAGGFTLTIFNSDRAVLTMDATPADIAAAAQGVARGSRR
jgi:hypothetical protein